MADKKITELTELTTADSADVILVVDVSDTTDATTGTTKHIKIANIRPTLFLSPDIDGGTIDGATIGGTTPAAGAFTTLKQTTGAADGAIPISDADGDLILTASTGIGAPVRAVSPAMTGTPTAPTATSGTNTTQLATTAFVQTEVTAVGIATVGAADRENVIEDLSYPGEVEFEKVTVDNLVIDGNDISSSSGDITLSPKAGSDVVVDGHWEFDGPALAALTDNNTTITAYAGKNITIESVTFDGGVVGGVSSIDIDGGTIDGATIGATTAGTVRSLLDEDAEIVTADATLTANQCSGGLISNYNQSLDCTVTVPTAFAGGNFIVVLSTAVAKYYRLDPTGSEVWVWDGVAQAAGKYIGVAAATVGAALQFIAVQTGASTWTWHVYTVAGAWSVEG